MPFDAPPPPPVAAEVRTMEEMGMDQADTAGVRIVEVARIVLRRYLSGDRKPSYRNVRFETASRLSRCQQVVRELVEATMYGGERHWKEASCCARSTQIRLHNSFKKGRLMNAHFLDGTSAKFKIIEIKDVEKIEPGDIIYTGGGRVHCSSCGRSCGHVMIYTGKKNGKLMMWQNTSYEDKALCSIPLRKDQQDDFLAAYRFVSNDIKNRIPLRKELTNKLVKNIFSVKVNTFSNINSPTFDPFKKSGKIKKFLP